MSVYEAAKLSVSRADHLTDADRGAVEAMLVVAKQIDFLTENEGLNESGKFDNVSVPVFLKYCDSLGLTPAGRKVGTTTKKPVGKLQQLKGGLSA